MPLYEYQCSQCAHRFEMIQKFSDPPVGACPKCGGEVKKLLSSPAIQFKGTGWYITDYARAAKTDSAAGAGDGEKKDAKPAAAAAGEPTSGASKTEGDAKAGSSKTNATSTAE